MPDVEMEYELQSATVEEQKQLLAQWFGYSESCDSVEVLYQQLQPKWSERHFLWLLAKLSFLGLPWAREVREIALLNIDSVPDVLQAFPELRHLELAGTFEVIPESIGRLTRLLSLKAKGRFTTLPVSLGKLQYLCQIELTTEGLTHLPESVLWFFSHPDVDCRLYTENINDVSTRKMRAVVCCEKGSVEVLKIQQVIAPSLSSGYIRVKLHGVGVNRADVLQRKGAYPAPFPARAEILGLEYSGEVLEVGAGVTQWRIGDRVMGITAGGAYAEEVVVHALEALPVPDGMDLVEAAAIPEVFMTAYDALFTQANVQMGDRVLIHAVGSGVGLAAMQLANAVGATVVGSSRTQAKVERALKEGLSEGIWVRDGLFARRLQAPVDVVIDFIGAAYWKENIRALNLGGRMILVGLLGGRKAEVNLGALLQKRLTVQGTVLRSRTLEEKIRLAQRFRKQVLPLFASGALRTTVDVIYPLEEVAKAHVFMESNQSYGKIVLRV